MTHTHLRTRDTGRRGIALAALLLALAASPAALLLALAASPAAPEAEAPPADRADADAVNAEPAGADTPKVTATFVRSQWHSLYLSDEKAGYTTESLYRLSDGGRRLRCNTFLCTRRGALRFGYYRKTTADVDAHFRPQAVTCEVHTDGRHWRVAGQARQGVLRLERTVDGETAATAILLEDDMTFRCWALPATVMSGPSPGATRRWLVIDASLGAVLPDPYLVRVLGPRTLPGKSEDERIEGTAIITACGLEQVVHLVDADGRVLRRLWQTSPMVAEQTSLSEARRLKTAAEAPPSAVVPGLSHRGYRSDRLGLHLYVPPIPYAPHVVDQAGALRITNLADEAYVEVRPVHGPPPPAALADADAGRGDDDAQTPPLASLPIHKEWAARFDEVTAEASRAAVPGGAEGAEALGLTGRARLGCTTFHYRNLLLWGKGLTWFVSVMVADRPIQAEPALSENVIRSLRIEPPEGRLPLQTIGTTIRSPLYGFQVRLPSKAWVIPDHTGGLPTALEIARTDQAAVALIRMMDRDADETLEAFVRDQAELAAKRLGVPEPEPKAVMLAGLPGYELVYEGDGLLSGRRAECTLVYVRRRGRVLALTLMVRSDAGAAVRREVEQVRKSLRFLP